MKITAGFNSIDDYPLLCEAGADELFCGYVPYEWQRRSGSRTPFNRREVIFTGVQIGSESEIRILASMKSELHVPVTLTLNALSYPPEEYGFIADYIENCRSIGFSSFIVSDPALIVFLHSAGLTDKIGLHVSGEFGAVNSASVGELARLGAERLIFHRQLMPQEMKKLTASGEIKEYEAFFLNEKCHFSGGMCCTLHCDELPPICRVPYVLRGSCEDMNGKSEISGRDSGFLGAGGCAFCRMWELRECGITHLKIVGRGNCSENILRDVKAAKRAVNIMNAAENGAEYIESMKRELFPDGCSGTCYY